MQVINEDLSFCPYHRKELKILICVQRIKRLQNCKKLLNRHCSKSVGRVIFSDELFCTEQNYNAKNVVVYLTIFNDIFENLLIVKRFWSKNSVMVLAAVSHN